MRRKSLPRRPTQNIPSAQLVRYHRTYFFILIEHERAFRLTAKVSRATFSSLLPGLIDSMMIHLPVVSFVFLKPIRMLRQLSGWVTRVIFLSGRGTENYWVCCLDTLTLHRSEVSIYISYSTMHLRQFHFKRPTEQFSKPDFFASGFIRNRMVHDMRGRASLPSGDHKRW